VDIGSGATVATVVVGENPVDLDGPHHIALDRPRGFAYVALSYPAPSASPRRGVVQKLRLSDLRVVGQVTVDVDPGDIVLSEDGRRLVVTHFDLRRATAVDAGAGDRRATLALLDPEKILPSKSPDPLKVTVCAAPHGVALSRPSGELAYVACYGDDSVAVLDLRSPSTAPLRVPLGNAARSAPSPPVYGPYSVALSPSGSLLVVGNLESKDLRFIDVGSATLTTRVVPTQGAPYFSAWASDGTELYVPTQAPDAVRVLDATSGTLKRARTFTTLECEHPHEAVIGRDTETVWIVCEGDRSKPSVVLGLDRSTLATKWTVPVGVYPDRLVLGEDR
jgi:DNA-binding beta-propeller fold protein YncE